MEKIIHILILEDYPADALLMERQIRKVLGAADYIKKFKNNPLQKTMYGLLEISVN